MPAWATSPTQDRSSADSERYHSWSASICRTAAVAGAGLLHHPVAGRLADRHGPAYLYGVHKDDGVRSVRRLRGAAGDLRSAPHVAERFPVPTVGVDADRHQRHEPTEGPAMTTTSVPTETYLFEQPVRRSATSRPAGCTPRGSVRPGDAPAAEPRSASPAAGAASRWPPGPVRSPRGSPTRSAREGEGLRHRRRSHPPRRAAAERHLRPARHRDRLPARGRLRRRPHAVAPRAPERPGDRARPDGVRGSAGGYVSSRRPRCRRRPWTSSSRYHAARRRATLGDKGLRAIAGAARRRRRRHGVCV